MDLWNGRTLQQSRRIKLYVVCRSWEKSRYNDFYVFQSPVMYVPLEARLRIHFHRTNVDLELMVNIASLKKTSNK